MLDVQVSSGKQHTRVHAKAALGRPRVPQLQRGRVFQEACRTEGRTDRERLSRRKVRMRSAGMDAGQRHRRRTLHEDKDRADAAADERATGVDKSFISRLMNGHKVAPSAETLEAMGLRAVPLYEVLKRPNAKLTGQGGA